MSGWDVLQATTWGGVPLMVVGLVVFVRGIRRMAQRLRGPIDEWAWMTGFRVMVLGFGVTGIGLAWLTWQGWILAIALGITGEELLESSGMIAAMRQQRRQRGLI